MLHKRWLLVAALLSASLATGKDVANEAAEAVTESAEGVGAAERLQAKPSGRECLGGGDGGGGGGEDGEAAELSVESGLNATGHWLAKVRLQHLAEGPEAAGEGGRLPLQLEVRRWARRGGRQGDARLITLQATLTGPSASSSFSQGHSATSKEGLPWSDWNPGCPACPRLPFGADYQPPPPQPPPTPCPTCPSPPPTPPPKPCPSPCPAPCPSPAPCPTCPSPPQPPPPKPCPSPCPAPCPSPAPCPACPVPPTPQPVQCPSPCATPPACPTCPSCPACPAPQKCPSPCPTPPPCPACPACPKPVALGYERHTGFGAYRVHLIPLNWFEAQATCEREGAHLAVINSQAEADLLSRILRNQPVTLEYVSIGFHDLYNEGTYLSVLDKPLHSSGYYKWRRGEPNNDGNEDCGGLYVGVMGLNDHRCHSLTVPFICEMP